MVFAQDGQDRVAGGGNGDGRSEHRVVADPYLRVVDHAHERVDVDDFAEVYATASVARMQWRFDVHAVADFGAHVFEQFGAPLPFGGFGLVVFP